MLREEKSDTVSVSKQLCYNNTQKKRRKTAKKKKKEILAFDFESLKCGIMSEEQGMLWRPSFPRVEAGRWQHNYRETSHNMWLSKQCILSPPKVPVSLLSLCVCLLNSCVACVFLRPQEGKGGESIRIREHLYVGIVGGIACSQTRNGQQANASLQ